MRKLREAKQGRDKSKKSGGSEDAVNLASEEDRVNMILQPREERREEKELMREGEMWMWKTS